MKKKIYPQHSLINYTWLESFPPLAFWVLKTRANLCLFVYCLGECLESHACMCAYNQKLIMTFCSFILVFSLLFQFFYSMKFSLRFSSLFYVSFSLPSFSYLEEQGNFRSRNMRRQYDGSVGEGIFHLSL